MHGDAAFADREFGQRPFNRADLTRFIPVGDTRGTINILVNNLIGSRPPAQELLRVSLPNASVNRVPVFQRTSDDKPHEEIDASVAR